MPDIAAIGSILSSVKTATDIARAIKDADVSIEKAELKYRIADLVGALADAKIAIADVQATLLAKDEEIASLKQTLERSRTMVRHREAYYDATDSGSASGDPYCLHCWEAAHSAIHLVQRNFATRQCPACKTVYSNDTTPKNLSG